MDERAGRSAGAGWSRARVLRGVLGGAAAIGGGIALGRRSDATPLAAPSKDTDAEILRVLLLLERIQEAFYGAALERARLEGKLLRYATTVGRQESQHVAYLTKQLDGRTPAAPRTDFGDSLSDPDRFRDTAIELEEATLAVYIGQGANLTRQAVAGIAGLVSVEARQVAWVRDLAGVSPAPRAADPARKPEAVLSDLREKGFIE
jgi:hypothetical protein